LANGCLCCSIKDSGVAAIEKLMERKGAFDHILLETTGLADPGPIASVFWHNEEFSTGLGRDIMLDGVICVVDAVFGQQQMEEDHAGDTIGESLRQIAGSDVILLNKIDVVSQEQASSIKDLIHKVNPAAPIYETVRGEIDMKRIIGIAAYSSPPQLRDPVLIPSAHDHDPDDHSHDHGHNHPSATHYEVRGISSVLVTCPVLSAVRMERLDEWIRTVLWENRLPGQDQDQPSNLQVLRFKGLFTLDTGEQYVVQGVRSMYDISALATEEVMGVPEDGKLVLIGKGLDERVRHSLEKVINDDVQT